MSSKKMAVPTTIEEMVRTRYIPSWNDLNNIEEPYGGWWYDKMVYGWAEKGRSWRVPLLPKVSDRSIIIRKKLPHLTDKQINNIIKGLNGVLLEHRKDDR